MDIPSIIVVFVCAWWVSLFTVLPLWVKRDESGPEVSGPGAPERPFLKKKFLITTVIAAVITLCFYGAIEMNLFSFADVARDMTQEDYQ